MSNYLDLVTVYDSIFSVDSSPYINSENEIILRDL